MQMIEKFEECLNADYKTAGNDVNYAFVEADKKLTILFQGSSSVKDWIRNFMFKKRPYKDMKIPYKVHRGFLAAWKEVEDIIIAKITEKDERGAYKFWLIETIGYSHGAALAGLCHECVWFWRPDLRNLGAGAIKGFAFEAPRFYGGFHVKKSLKERWRNFYVIRNKNDIVTHMPPWLFRFCHVGTLIHIGKGVELIRHTRFKCVDAHYPDNVSNSLIRID